MTPADVKAALGDLPWMTLEQGAAITDFVRRQGSRSILELGFHHGVSTCYLAAALDAAGGSVTTIDLEHARDLSPSIEELLARLGLERRVTVHYESSCYTWRLMKLLEEDPTPRFDFCYLDAAHRWQVDGFGFFLVDRLLKPGGWLVFDDLDWKAVDYPQFAGEPWYQRMSREERETAQMRKVYELLVKPHPRYGDFRTEGGWAYARKLRDDEAPPIRTETVVKPVPVSRELLREQLKKRRPGAGRGKP